MASLRKVKCPYCSFTNTKEKVINHIELKHEDMIPQGFTAARVLFNFINKKDHGTCVICKGNTTWNEKTNKYNRLCNKPECKNKLREIYKKNMLKVYGKTTLLNDPEQQKKMLANRSISGVYKFSNGKIKEYTGSFEKKFLQFMDTMMGYDPDDIIMPGPTLEYEYNGEKHQWITDALIVPYNLIIEVKDGGDFKNNRSMVSYREKQVAKEEMITNMGKYNYLRLTNNQFGQLIDILYDLKMQMIDDSDDNKKTIVKIHEGFFDDLKKNIKITHQNLNPKDEKTKIAFISEKNYKDKSYNKNIPVFNKSELKKRLLYAGIKRQIPRSDYNDMRKLVVMPESIWNEYKNENILIFEINKENCKKIETTANALNSTVAKLGGFDVYYTVTKDKLKNLIKKETVRNIIKNTGYRLTTLWNSPNHPGRDLNINESLDELDMTNGQKVYKRYLEIHKRRLKDSFNSRIIPLKNALLLSEEECYELRDRILKHDKSRMSDEEFDPLRKAKFPEDEQEKKEGKKEKDAAWKHHYALNDHHPEHWKGKEIPNIVIAEMIIDWETDCRHDGGNPLNWYLNTKEGIETQKKINPKTRLIIERVLKTIYNIDMNLKDNYDRDDDPIAVKEDSQPLFISEKDVEYRLDDFKNHKVPVLWITGLSGGGKTTTTKKLANEMSCECFSIDNVEQFVKLFIKNNMKKMDEWIHWNPNFKIIHDYLKKNPETGYQEDDDKWYKFESNIIELIVKAHSNSNPIIIEGIQIPTIFRYKKSIFNNSAIIIKGTSITTSIMRRIKRDQKRGEFINNFEDIGFYMKEYYNMYKGQNNFRDKAIKESSDSMKTITEISKIIEKVKEYEEYIKEHIQNVRNSYNDRKAKIQLVLGLSEGDMQELENRIKNHDTSKWSNDEFDAYRRHFHSVSDKEKEDSEEDFKKALNHHYMVNDHHPEYWKNTDMPNIAIAELICDWEAMGRKFGGNPLEYFEKNKTKLKTKMNEYSYNTIYNALKNIYDIKMDLKESVNNEDFLNPRMLNFTFDKDIYINYDKPYKVYKCYPYAFYDYNLPRLKVDPMVMNQNKKLAIYGCIYLMTKGATGSNTFKPLEIKKSWWEKHKRDRVYWIESKKYHEYKGQLIVDGTNKNNYKAIVTTLDKLIHTEGSKVITINFY